MSKGCARRSIIGAVVAPAVLLLFAGSSQAAYESVPTPTVSGPLPVTKTSYPFLATDIDLKKYGYVEQEFLYTGRAYQYNWPTAPGSPVDQTATRVEDGGYNFKTRMIVRRPAKAKDFNGVVIAEWMNVTALYDLEANWFGDPYYLLKNGYAFVGISAQSQGVSTLCCNSIPALGIGPFNPARYQGLNVDGGGAFTNDALSYDIYSSALKAVRGQGEGSNPLGNLSAPKTVIASGESQSCGRLGNHYNRVEPLHQIVDGYLLTVCTNPKLRSDRPEKAVRILSETETARGPVTDPDGPSFRKWEVAGGSHLPRLAFNNFNDVVTRDRAPLGVKCSAYPLSLVQWPFTQNKAIAELVSWSKGGVAPATGPSMEYSGSSLVRDAKGIAQGGIRLPEVEVPTGVNTGVNSAVGTDLLSNFCGLLGSYTAFPASEVEGLHGNLRKFVTDSGKVADGLVKQGFLLKEDAARLKEIARQYAELNPGKPVAKALGKGMVKLSWFGTTAPRTTFEVVRSKSGGKPKWKTVKAKVKGQKVTLSGQSRGRWIYAVRSKTKVEYRDPTTNQATYPLRTTGYSDASKPVRVK
ncbi:MAG: alpha/beta hydrolase domain-containing protein [Solirubrobacterales bacterium]